MAECTIAFPLYKTNLSATQDHQKATLLGIRFPPMLLRFKINIHCLIWVELRQSMPDAA